MLKVDSRMAVKYAKYNELAQATIGGNGSQQALRQAVVSSQTAQDFSLWKGSIWSGRWSFEVGI